MDAHIPFVKYGVGVSHGPPHPLSLAAGVGTIIHNVEIRNLDETHWFHQAISSGSSCGRWKPEKKVGLCPRTRFWLFHTKVGPQVAPALADCQVLRGPSESGWQLCGQYF